MSKDKDDLELRRQSKSSENVQTETLQVDRNLTRHNYCGTYSFINLFAYLSLLHKRLETNLSH